MVREQSPGSFKSSLGSEEGQGIPLPEMFLLGTNPDTSTVFLFILLSFLNCCPRLLVLKEAFVNKGDWPARTHLTLGGLSGKGLSRAIVLFQHPNSHVPAPPLKLMFPDSGGLEGPGQFPHIQITGTFLIGLWREKQKTKPWKSRTSGLSVCVRLSLISCLLPWSCPPISWFSRRGSQFAPERKRASWHAIQSGHCCCGSSLHPHAPIKAHKANVRWWDALRRRQLGQLSLASRQAPSICSSV